MGGWGAEGVWHHLPVNCENKTLSGLSGEPVRYGDYKGSEGRSYSPRLITGPGAAGHKVKAGVVPGLGFQIFTLKC